MRSATKATTPSATSIAACVAAIFMATPVHAALMAIASSPLFVSSPIQPNLLVIFDNSESMDGVMSGPVVSGDNPATRSNIARGVMRTAISTYRSAFNWGLMTYDMGTLNPQWYQIHGYFLGGNTTMVFTDDCQQQGGVGPSDVFPGLSPSNRYSATYPNPALAGTPLRCIPNPQSFSPGGRFVTIEYAADDPDILDALFSFAGDPFMWGISPGPGWGTNYFIRSSHNSTTSWALNQFSLSGPFGPGPIGFSPTDAGFLSTEPSVTRQVYIYRGWGLLSGVTGDGYLNEPVQADSASHFNNLMSLLQPQQFSYSGEIRDGALYTPLAGSLDSAKKYFRGSYRGQPSPIQLACQKNFVALVTDGLPTARTNGSLYSLSERYLPPSPPPPAAPYPYSTSDLRASHLDTIASVAALRTTNLSGNTYDIQTYIVGLGNTVDNPGAIYVMNQMGAAGGTGNALLASNPAAFSTALETIAQDIKSKTGAAAALALNSSSTNSSSKLFQGKFESSEWWGKLIAYPLNPDGTTAAQAWDASLVLNGQNWNSGRTVLSYKPSTQRGIAFRWPAVEASPTASELDPTQIAALNKNAVGVTDGNGRQRLEYLRGSAADEGVAPLSFRVRPTTKLGDIVNSAPAFVGAPVAGYSDSLESARYSSFVSAYRSRTPVVYVGANDGMLHGFDANTGQELLAYVPSAVYNNLSKLPATNYSHKYFVDGSPFVQDAFIGGAWRTVLVSGLNAGGQSLFALDVTDPSSFTEASAASRVLWEFNDAKDTVANDPDGDALSQYALGYTFSEPTIVRMNNDKWVAVFGNGYNNSEADGRASTTGHAVLYILDLQTGAVIKKISTRTGSAVTPNGLATPTPVDVDNDGSADFIYAGDLLGNVWKFDVSSSDPAAWQVALGTTTAPLPVFTAQIAGVPQPITEPIEVGRHPVSGLLLLFGTGKYLEISDITSTGRQSFYAIWDHGVQIAGRSRLRTQSVISETTISGDVYRITSNTAFTRNMWGTAAGQYEGWLLDLPTTKERQVTRPLLHSGRIIFTTLIPDPDPCEGGGSSWLMELDAFTGGQLPTPPLDTNRDGQINATGPTADALVSGRKSTYITSMPTFIGLTGSGAPKLEMKSRNTSGGTIVQDLETTNSRTSSRISWEELLR